MVIALVAYALYYLLPKVINPPSKQDQSVLVLPFTNYTGDTLDYFVEGMHDILIGNVGKISALRVLGRTTANAYKDTEKSLPEIAEELGVNTFIEGSVLCLGDDSVCLQVQVRSTYPQEKQLWIKDFKVERSEILNLYNRVTKEISGEIGTILTPKEEQLLAKSRTIDKEVYDSYLRAQKYDGDLSRESLYKALDDLNGAIEKEPDWAPLYSALAGIWAFINQVGYEPASVTFPEIYKNLYKALELDPNLSEVHRGLALIAYLIEWDWEKSEREFLKALAINPNDAKARALYGQLLCNLQRIDEAIAQGRLALELDPLSPEIKGWSGAIFFGVGDFKTALDLAEEITAVNPGDLMGNSLLEFTAFRCKEYDKMIKAWRYLLPVLFKFTEEDMQEIEIIFNDQGYIAAYEKVLKHLEEYAENNHISAISMAASYIMANQPDKAMDWLEKGFEQKDPKVPNITTIFYFEPLFNNPRFIAICKKINLPLP
jgi:TolB-like protein